VSGGYRSVIPAPEKAFSNSPDGTGPGSGPHASRAWLPRGPADRIGEPTAAQRSICVCPVNR